MSTPPASPQLFSQASNPIWKGPHPKLNKKDADDVRAAVAAIPIEHLHPPKQHEEDKDVATGFIRLQNYAFATGYVYVTSSGSAKNSKAKYQCSHHDEQTKNWRGLTEEHRNRQAEDKKYVNRPNTSDKRLGCPHKVNIVYKRVAGGGGRRAWMIGITCWEHSHPFAVDPFYYIQYRPRRPGYRQAIDEAVSYRSQNKSASSFQDSLSAHGLSDVDKRTFYNILGRVTAPEMQANQQRFNNLLEVLEIHDFRIKPLTHWRLDPQTLEPQDRVLDQVVFASSSMINMAQRFLGDFSLTVDATFSTNYIGLLLSAITGVTNSMETFPVCLSFKTSESKESFIAEWEFLNKYVYRNNFKRIPKARVAIGDQTAGFVCSLEDESMKLQLCQWHAAESIKRKLAASGGYTKQERSDIAFTHLAVRDVANVT